MSGICGIAVHGNERQVRYDDLTPMVKGLTLSPKGQGYKEIVESIGFGARDFPGRLTGVAQHQEQGRSSLFGFHGSIYNLDDVLAPMSDCENPVQALLQLSLRGIVSLLKSLRGEFVVSFWDASKETLFLATDRFRVHPLFYRQDQEKLVFGSRMQSILACPFVEDFTVNPSAIIDVVSSSCIPTPKTIFQEVQKVPPGHLLVWKQGDVKIERYWDISFTGGNGYKKSELFTGVKEKFSDALMVRLKHDGDSAQVGSFLSGGVDSSTILGVMTQLAQQSIKSFSIGFDEERFNETSFARCAAEAFKANHHEYMVSAEDTFQVLDGLVNTFDEPYANASAIPTYFCSKLAKEHGVDFLYGGDGGDELFAGNERYATQKVFDYYGMFPRWLRDYGIQPTVFYLESLTKVNLFRKGKKYIQRANTPYPERLFSWGLFEVLSMEDLFSRDFLDSLGGNYDPQAHVRELYAHSTSLATTELDRQLYLDLNLIISDNDLVKVTRMTEANGVAVRFPFLDSQLAEFSACVPAHIKMQGTKLRTFFKEAYADLLPQDVLTKTKHGFGLPIPVWLRTDKKLRDLMMDLLLSQRVRQRGYYANKTFETLIERHQQDTTSFFGTILWNFVMLELWLRRYCDKN